MISNKHTLVICDVPSSFSLVDYASILLPKVGWVAGSSKDLTLFKEETLKDIHGWSCATFLCIENTSIENMVSNSLRYSINSHESSWGNTCWWCFPPINSEHWTRGLLYLGRCNVLWQKLFAALNLNAEMKTKTSTMNFVDEEGNLQQRIDTAFLEFQRVTSWNTSTCSGGI